MENNWLKIVPITAPDNILNSDRNLQVSRLCRAYMKPGQNLTNQSPSYTSVFKRVLLHGPIAFLVLGMEGLYGQDYPTKPIRLVTGGVGGAADLTARIVAQRLA